MATLEGFVVEPVRSCAIPRLPGEMGAARPGGPHPAIRVHLFVSEFDDDTRITDGPDGLMAQVSERWGIAGRPNGGYLIALAARALGREAGLPDPLTLTAHYLRPPTGGPARIDVERIRRGRAHATLAGRLRQGDKEFLRVLGTYGDLAAASGPTRLAGSAPALPPPEDCIPSDEGPPSTSGVHSTFFDRLEVRLAPPGFVTAADYVGQVQGWVRFADGREPDVASLLLFADAFPPAVFAQVPAAWVPTVELTVHVRGRPAPGWLIGSFRTRYLVDGYLEEDGELWDSTGRLVALSRQLALTRGR